MIEFDDTSLAAAQAGDSAAFERLVASHRRELHAHCYRMLGSLHDAEDALQETLVAAWQGLADFERRSSLRSWLYRIATRCCLRLAERRPPRMLSWDHGPARSPQDDLGAIVPGPVWLDPWPGGVDADPSAPDPADAYVQKEGIELAYVAALQHLPPNQRAVLILRDVLSYSAAEVADLLDTSTAAANSALQRARVSVAQRVPGRSQQHELDRLDAGPTGGKQSVVDAFVTAMEERDIAVLVALLADDVSFTMPPLPAWFDGRDDVAAFFAQRVFETPWRLVPVTVNAQPAVACYQWDGAALTLGAVNVLTLTDGKISWIGSFLDPNVLGRLGLPTAVEGAP